MFVTHTRAGRILGLLEGLVTGSTLALGYRNRGGTLDVDGMLYLNGQSWAHIVEAAARSARLPIEELLTDEERAALAGRIAPPGLLQSSDGARLSASTPTRRVGRRRSGSRTRR